MVFDKAGCYAPVSKLEKHQSIFNTLKPTKDDHIGAPQAEQRWMPVKATRLWGPSPTNTLMVPPPRSIEVVSRDLGHRQGGAWSPPGLRPGSGTGMGNIPSPCFGEMINISGDKNKHSAFGFSGGCFS